MANIGTWGMLGRWQRQWFQERSRSADSPPRPRGRMRGHHADDGLKAEMSLRARVRSAPVIIF